MQRKRGIVLFAHGSRDPLWRLPVEAVAQRARERSPDAVVACAYLELMEPDLPTAATALIAQGAIDIKVLPMFLGVGKHAREDLPLLVERLTQQHAGVNFMLERAVGEDERLIDLLASIALE